MQQKINFFNSISKASHFIDTLSVMTATAKITISFLKRLKT